MLTGAADLGATLTVVAVTPLLGVPFSVVLPTLGVVCGRLLVPAIG